MSEIKPLADLCDCARSICYGIVQPGRHLATGLPIIRVADLRGNRLDLSEVMRVEPDIEAKYRRSRVRTGDVLVSLVGSLGQVVIAPAVVEGWNIARAVGLIPAKDRHHAEWIVYSLQSPQAQRFIQTHANTTVQATFNLKDLARIPIPYPPRAEREGTLAVLGALDGKIELNRRLNQTLEEMARALFRSWFVDFDPVRARAVGRAPAHMDRATAALFPACFGEHGLPEGWREVGLDEIATFLNGLALQKFPPLDGEDGLPAIKIAELRSGVTEKSGRASALLPQKYVIKDGDVLFSWSGSLTQKVWADGPGALNQHLFKVSSEQVPKWFHYHAVDLHMEHFQSIAASKATTMGHIQRHHLSEAKVTVPDAPVLRAADALVAPLFELGVKNDLQSRTLATLRDALLPKLMSGELRVRDAERALAQAV